MWMDIGLREQTIFRDYNLRVCHWRNKGCLRVHSSSLAVRNHMPRLCYPVLRLLWLRSFALQYLPCCVLKAKRIAELHIKDKLEIWLSYSRLQQHEPHRKRRACCFSASSSCSLQSHIPHMVGCVWNSVEEEWLGRKQSGVDIPRG